MTETNQQRVKLVFLLATRSGFNVDLHDRSIQCVAAGSGYISLIVRKVSFCSNSQRHIWSHHVYIIAFL